MLNELILFFNTNSGITYLQNIGFFVFLTGFSAFLTNICRRRIKIMDFATERSSHTGAMPRSGGIAIVSTFCLGIIAYYFLHNEYFVGQLAFLGLFFSALIVALVSFYDDVTDKGLMFKFVSQLAGVVILIGFGLTINEVSIPFYGKVVLGIYRYPLTFLWIVGITNAFNFMDGLNGLAAGVAVIVSLVFSFITFFSGSGFVFHVSYIIAASCIGFLFFNFPKASIFMGDVGSSFLGFSFGALAILAANYDFSHTPFMAVPILMSNFIMEAFFTFIWRLLRRKPVLKAHCTHTYELLHRMGVHAAIITLIYYLQSILLALICYIYIFVVSDTGKTVLLCLIIFSYLVFFIEVRKYARRYSLI